MPIIVGEAVATALFTICRLLYGSFLAVFAIILFSKLHNGSSAKFWYDQPDIVSKITSLFHPYGPTGRRGGVAATSIAVICSVLALALNFIPTLLSNISPIRASPEYAGENATLSAISNVVVPTLTDINLPFMTNPDYSNITVNKFLCQYLPNGCKDAQNHTVASLVWDNITPTPLEFYHDAQSGHVVMSVRAAPTSPSMERMLLANGTFLAALENTSSTAEPPYLNWTNSDLFGYYLTPPTTSPEGAAAFAYNVLHADQVESSRNDSSYIYVLPDPSETLHQTTSIIQAPTNGFISRAEKWNVIHQTENISTLVWQTVNVHSGTIDANWQTYCFFCNLLGVESGSGEEVGLKTSVTAISALPENETSVLVTIRSSVTEEYRLETILCSILPNGAAGLTYNCMHSYTQMWSINHESQPYEIIRNLNGLTEADIVKTGIPFPFLTLNASSITNNRTYAPSVPVFEIQRLGKCDTDWNYATQRVGDWMDACLVANLGQPNQTGIETVARAIWQLNSAITAKGFLVHAEYFNITYGIEIGVVPQIIMLVSVGFALVGNLILMLVTSPVHRSSLYEVMRSMLPESTDPYRIQQPKYTLQPTNTLYLADSVFEKNLSYLMLDHRLIVTLSDETMDDDATVNTGILDRKEIQDWSRQQILNI
ncbi:hypothetical protein K501DRAFT_282133 [Backusella circina FSU 941]|nr:hypothetical protein K501DRAFT_282133 [Backusella circina FSU 941]